MTQNFRFLMDVESRNLSNVQHQLRTGSVSANDTYLGVHPLNLAVEQGDADMVAVLLREGADVTHRPNGSASKDTLGLAMAMRDNPKCKYRQEAAVIVEMMQDQEVLKRRWTDVQIKIKKQEELETRKMMQLALLLIPGLGIFCYWFMYLK